MVVAAPLGAKRSEKEEQVIKGPGIRLDLDVRRVWRCPQCQRVLKTAGHITSRRCPIDGEFMQLDDSAQRATSRFSFPPITIDQVDEVEDTVDGEHPATEQPIDDDDRPRKQSRKQKRRQRRDPDDDHEDLNDSEPTSDQEDGSPETTSPPPSPPPSPDDEPDTDTEDQPSQET